MSAPQSQIQWYLARDGKQYGPLSDPELAKFIELGHLLPSDLLWREGFAEWQPAPSVFPLPAPAMPGASPEPEPEAGYAAQAQLDEPAAHVSPEPELDRGPHAPQEAIVHAAEDRFGGPQQLSAQAPAGRQHAAHLQSPQHQQAHPHAGQPHGVRPGGQPGGQPGGRPAGQPGGQPGTSRQAQLQPGAQHPHRGQHPQQGQPRQPARGQQPRAQGNLQLGVPQGSRRIDPAEFDEDTDFEPGGKVLRKILLVLVLVAVLAAAGYGAYSYRGETARVAGTADEGPRKAQPAAAVVSDRKTLDVPPLQGLAGDAAQLDDAMQRAALWRVLKREFPEWYAERLKAVADLSAQSVDAREIAQKTAQSLVQLRRQHLAQALSASVPRLRLIATTFFENLSELRKTSEVACFEFIARGESSPLIVTMLQGSPHVARLQTQMAAIYEAIADGRTTPRAYPNPKREDYEKLAADLQKDFNWTQGDLQLFTNERELAQASPGKVCQLVHDWFAAQLAIKDPDMQVRLLVDSLKPVVAG